MSKENNFSVMHMCAAYMVILGHAYMLLGRPSPIILDSTIHEMGVNILFVISGYLVTGSFLRSDTASQYYFKRFVRLYPSLVVCLITTVSAMFFLSDSGISNYLGESLFYILYNIVMFPRYVLPGVFENNPYKFCINGSLWTLPIEMALFLLLPVIVRLINKFKYRKSIVAIGMAFAISIFAVCFSTYYPNVKVLFWGTNWISGIRLLAYFLSGVAFRTLTIEQIRKYCRMDIAMAMFVVTLCLGESYSQELNYFLLPYIIMSIAFCNISSFREFFNRHDYAYGLYLWSFPIQQTLVHFCYDKYNVPVLVYFVITVLISTLLAILTNKFVENPIKSMINKRVEIVLSKKKF